MSTEPPQEPPTEIAPPPYQGQPTFQGAPPPEPRGGVGPWILAAALVLVLGAVAAVLIHNADTSDTQTVITPTVNTTSVERSGPGVTQQTTTVSPPERTTTTVTVQPRTETEPQTGGTTGP
jgi:hypothetical protein